MDAEPVTTDLQQSLPTLCSKCKALLHSFFPQNNTTAVFKKKISSPDLHSGLHTLHAAASLGKGGGNQQSMQQMSALLQCSGCSQSMAMPAVQGLRRCPVKESGLSKLCSHSKAWPGDARCTRGYGAVPVFSGEHDCMVCSQTCCRGCASLMETWTQGLFTCEAKKHSQLPHHNLLHPEITYIAGSVALLLISKACNTIVNVNPIIQSTSYFLTN